jgi:DNA repair ATPase RecN
MVHLYPKHFMIQEKVKEYEIKIKGLMETRKKFVKQRGDLERITKEVQDKSAQLQQYENNCRQLEHKVQVIPSFYVFLELIKLTYSSLWMTRQ